MGEAAEALLYRGRARASRAASWHERAENGCRDEEEERGRKLFTALVGDGEPPVEGKHKAASRA